MHQVQQHPLSIEDYLKGELESEIRHEFMIEMFMLWQE